MLILGHRGAPMRAPENSLESFEKALQAGADGVELDVRMSVDGALVVRHDEQTPDGRCVSATAFAELGLPTLDEALDAVGDAWCVVELKSQPGRTEPFVDAVAAVLDGRAQALLVVSSFDDGLLRVLRRALPSVRTALTVGFLWSMRDVTWAVDEAGRAGHAQLHPERRCMQGTLGDALLGAATDARLELVPWTVNDPEEATVLRELGVAGVITDVPDVLASGVHR